jgi:hypothetical protein
VREKVLRSADKTDQQTANAIRPFASVRGVVVCSARRVRLPAKFVSGFVKSTESANATAIGKIYAFEYGYHSADVPGSKALFYRFCLISVHSRRPVRNNRQVRLPVPPVTAQIAYRTPFSA